jgi:hypothetical protein
VDFLGGDGSIIVPKSVRPIIDWKETLIGSKKGAWKQFRYGNLHIREFKDSYTVHMDKVDPAKDPLGHLLMDAPEYLVASIVGLKFAQKAACRTYQGKNDSHAMKGLSAGLRAGVTAAVFSFAVTSLVKQINRRGR